jgi:hypothetical protein
MVPNDLSAFTFKQVGHGHYKVTYTTPIRGDYWIATINDMTLIDATKNVEYARGSDIKRLMDVVKQKGSHYSKSGKPIN